MAQLPAALQSAIDEMTGACERAALARDAQAISESYRLRTGRGERLLTLHTDTPERVERALEVLHPGIGDTPPAPRTLIHERIG